MMEDKTMNKEDLIRQIAYRIYLITGKNDTRTLQNWLDAEEIVNLFFDFCKKHKKHCNKQKDE
jgi:nicotinic acid mononucleotide adenylyltransferase